MYVIAIIGDLLSFVPVIRVVSGIITPILLWVAGRATGVNIFSSSNIGWTLATILVEEVPGLAMFPAFTVRVYFAKKQAAENSES
ncbi:MAG: hypothetical protein Q7S05_04605 [bacterium]|nr:hypothetical protein [bacterium]